MKFINQHQRLVIIALLVAAKLLSSIVSGAPETNLAGVSAQATATPTPAPAAAVTPTAVIPPGEVIPLKPLGDIKSLNATVTIGLNGVMNGKKTQGDLTALLGTNEQKQTQIDVSGSLLGPIVAQVGGSLVGLFTPKQVTAYKTPDGTFVAINGMFPVCVKPNMPNATESLDQISPANLMEMLTGSDVARGTFIGDETLNGKPVKHYKLNGKAFLAAAQQSKDPNVQKFAQSIWSADDADLYVSADGYPVSFRGSYSGVFEPLKFEGDFTVQIDVTGFNTNPTITLPSSCNNPISQ